MIKTHRCGELSVADDGSHVELAGWVNAHRDHGGVIFVDLRDSSGVVQIVCEAEDVAQTGGRVRDEWCVSVRGHVRRRPEGTVNAKLATGEVEVVAEQLEVLQASLPVPFPITDEAEAEEVTRLRYRYLDLRRKPLADNVRLRAKVTKVIRDYMDEHGFVDVETPLLGRSTPEGARDFLVPSRLQRGSFYALPQSPQIYKQILMVAGFERYYQIARCLRDEDVRANRVAEIAQLDLEMSFVDQRDVQELNEGLIQRLWRECLDEHVHIPFPRLTFAECMDRFGTDAPDLRAGPAIADLSAVFDGTGFDAFGKVLAGGGSIRGLRIPGAGSASRKELDELIERAKEWGAKGLVWMVVEETELRAPIAKFLSATEIEAIRTGLDVETGDLVLIVADSPELAGTILGRFRVDFAKSQGRVRTHADPRDWNFLWVVEFPMFEWSEEENRWDAMHNPFSAPTPETAHFLDTDPGKCRSLQYDLVVNGEEIAGGSIRNHTSEMQMKALRAMGFTDERARESFGFFLESLDYGAPPHGGIAWGIDRLCMVMAGTTSLRDVTAFPKSQTGADLLTGAPAPVEPNQLRDLGIKVHDKDKKE